MVQDFPGLQWYKPIGHVASHGSVFQKHVPVNSQEGLVSGVDLGPR